MKKISFARSAVLALVLAFSTYSLAEETGSRAIDTVGGQLPAIGFFSLVGGYGTTCMHNYLYIDVSQPGGKMAYGTVLAAKISGKPLKNVYFVKDGSGVCNVNYVMLN